MAEAVAATGLPAACCIVYDTAPSVQGGAKIASAIAASAAGNATGYGSVLTLRHTEYA